MTALTATGTAVAPQTTTGRVLIMGSVMLGTMMHVIDSTIANVVLPTIQGTLGGTRDTISWVLTSYIVATAVMMPATAWLAARFGRKQIFLLGIVGFTVSSILSGMATSLPQIVIFRIIQGSSGALLIPLSQSIIMDTFPKHQHPQVMAIWGAGIMVGPIIGPALGGWLAETWSWRWVFYINVPLGVLAFLGVTATLPKGQPVRRRFDMIGFFFLALGLGSLQLALDRGELKDWLESPEIIIEFALAACGFWMFMVHVLTARSTLINLRIFRDRNFVLGVVLGFALGALLIPPAALLPTMMQDLMGYPTITSGILVAARGIGTMVAMILTARLVKFIEVRILVAAAFAVLAVSFAQMTSFYTEMDSWPIITSGLVQGVGMGVGFTALTIVSFSSLGTELRTDGTAIFNLMRTLGSSIGISIAVTLLSHSIQRNHAELAERLNIGDLALDPVLTEKMIHSGSGGLLSVVDLEVTRQAAMIAYVNDFYFMMILALAMVPLAFFIRRVNHYDQQIIIE